MKKILFLIVIALVSLSSCVTKEYYTDYYENPDAVTMETNYITVYPTDWKSVNDGYGFYRYATVNLPAINSSVIDNGLVVAYLIDGAYDNMLPYIRSYNEGEIEVIRFDIEERHITFIIENHETNLPVVPTVGWQFKVVIVKSGLGSDGFPWW